MITNRFRKRTIIDQKTGICILRKYLPLVLAIVFLASALLSPAKAQAPSPFANCRFGAAGLSTDLVGFDLEQLNIGVYSDWTAGVPPVGLPTTIEYVQTVRVHQDKVGSSWHGGGPYVDPPSYSVKPDLTTLTTLAGTYPGSLWLIGNEIERLDWSNGDGTYGGQDEITPELYAKAFHEIRNTIKTADPTAYIALGGVIQATLLRLEYLNRVWDSYLVEHGYPLGNDVDVWNVHGFMLREVRASWGAEIPAGLAQNSGFLSEYDATTYADYQAIIAAHHNMAYYRQFIEDFRAWMAAHGQQNKPLINTEYGILYDIGPTQQVIDYMTSTFDYMLTATDLSTGYPADKYRLVQGWVWVGVNGDASWFPYGGLFNSSTQNLTAVGNAWKSYVADINHPLAAQAQHNLLATGLHTNPGVVFVPTGETADMTLKTDVSNSGNSPTSTGNNIQVKFWDGPPNEPGSNQIGPTQTLFDLPGCGRGSKRVEMEWPDREPGSYTWYVEVVSIGGETDSTDNVASGTFLVFEGEPTILYLPAVTK
jgi:hypothetical protein